jgi:hypothetical protein
MANLDNPHGFTPVQMAGVRPPTAYRIQGSEGTPYATALYIGDMVTLSGGYVIKGVAGATNQLLGAIVGFECINGGIKEGGYYPASSTYDWYALVADDPHQRFIAQCDGGGTLTQANMGGTVNLKITHAGSTVTNLSGMEIDSSAVSGAVTDQFRLIALAPMVDNALGANGEYIVEIHNHVLRQENNVDATS